MSDLRLVLQTDEGSLALACPMGANMIFGTAAGGAAVLEGPGILPRHFMVRRVGQRRFHISSCATDRPCIVNGVAAISLEVDSPFFMTLGGVEMHFYLEGADPAPTLSPRTSSPTRRRDYQLGQATFPSKSQPTAPAPLSTEQPSVSSSEFMPRQEASVRYLPPPPPPVQKKNIFDEAPSKRPSSKAEKSEISLIGVIVLLILTCLGTWLFIEMCTYEEPITPDGLETPHRLPPSTSSAELEKTATEPKSPKAQK